MKRDRHVEELFGDCRDFFVWAELKGKSSMRQTSFCDNMWGHRRFSAKIWGFLRFSAKSAPQKCCNSQEKWKSVKISEKLRIWLHLSLLVCPFYFPLIFPVPFAASPFDLRQPPLENPMADMLCSNSGILSSKAFCQVHVVSPTLRPILFVTSQTCS